MANFVQTLVDLFVNLGQLLGDLLNVLLAWGLVVAWVAWWLWAVNWRKAWPVLAGGAWVPVVLLVVSAALVWSQIAPAPLSLGFGFIPNFWWQLGLTSLLACSALFLGWVQSVRGWAPPEIPIYPPETEHAGDHGHGHGHGHH